MNNTPDFESIKQISPYGVEYWSARDLAPLLGYQKWERFEGAIERATISCKKSCNVVADHFPSAGKMVSLGSGSQREVNDYMLSRFACYLIAQNGDPRKKQMAAAQAYFAISTWENQLSKLYSEQQKRLEARKRVIENNKALNSAAKASGVLSRNFGVFHNAGYKGLYGGLNVADIKGHKRIEQHEDILDRMGREELAANEFRITQAEGQLRREGSVGEKVAIDIHHQVGKKVCSAIEDIGGTMPEDLPPEPSIKPLLEENRRKKRKNVKPPDEQGRLF